MITGIITAFFAIVLVVSFFLAACCWDTWHR